MSVTVADIDRLKRMTWAQLDRVALDAGVPLAKVRQAKTRDELRRAILIAQSKPR